MTSHQRKMLQEIQKKNSHSFKNHANLKPLNQKKPSQINSQIDKKMADSKKRSTSNTRSGPSSVKGKQNNFFANRQSLNRDSDVILKNSEPSSSKRSSLAGKGQSGGINNVNSVKVNLFNSTQVLTQQPISVKKHAS